MTYTFVGNKDYIKVEIDKLIEKEKSSNIINYSLEEVSIKKVIEELNTISLFGKKIVIVKDLEKIDDDNVLIKYLENQSDNILILTSTKELDKRKKITKVIYDKTNVKEVFSYDLKSFILKNLNDFKMSTMAINILINYCDNNINRVESELEKLKLYKLKEKEITEEDIKNLVRKGTDFSIFDLIDAINIKDKTKIFKIYNELLEFSESEDKVLYTIANHYRLLFQISIKEKTNSDSEIIKEYKMHPYRLTKLKEQVKLISQNDMLLILKKLSDIDIAVKSGKKDISTAMFMFFESL